MSELRVRKIQEFIKQEVSSMLLKEIKDPRLGFVTVTGVHLTGELLCMSAFSAATGKRLNLWKH